MVNMTRTITQRELRNDSGEIMRQLDEGATFVVTRRGVPVGELVPIRRRRFATRREIAAGFRTAPPIDVDQLRSELDRLVDQDITPRG
jgi:prevent-host-death family protein